MRYSLRIKMTLTLFVIVAGAIIGNWFINMIFQEKYYIQNKQEDLVEMYGMLNANLIAGKDVSSESRIEMVSFCENNTISVLAVDAGLSTKFHSGYSVVDNGLVERLKTLLFDSNNAKGNVILSAKEYILQTVDDDQSGQTYLEMYGNLKSGDMFVMRTSVESIEEVLSVSNQLIAYIGGVVLSVSLVVVIIFSIGLTARIERLVTISNEMSKLNFNIKYADEGEDEISVLGNNMNILSQKLESTISELKSANIELQRDIQKKEEIDNMRKEFLSNVSHELKTPIAIIQGYAEGLKESVNDDSESREFYCDVIMDEAQKMNKMVQKLLTLNQIEFGNRMVEMERFDIVAVIDQVLNKVAKLLEEKNATVIFDNKRQIYVWADEFQAEEVITNYITNAINHVDFEKVIKIQIAESDNVIRCTVFNTGNNIPNEDLDKIWEKFYKVDKARTREYGGSGIGLSIVKAIMTSMNRECGVRNVQSGVEFWFELEKCAENSNI